jgi:DNA-binding NarL/FixJ family response regulator
MNDISALRVSSEPSSGAKQQPGATRPDTGANPRRSIYLTPRQFEVLHLLCEGLPNKLICRRLNIAGATAKVHISSIFRELGVSGRLQAVVTARRLGFAEGCSDSWERGSADAGGSTGAGNAPRALRRAA